MSTELGSLWSDMRPVETDLESHFFDQAGEVDDVIFETRKTHGPHYG